MNNENADGQVGKRTNWTKVLLSESDMDKGRLYSYQAASDGS